MNFQVHIKNTTVDGRNPANQLGLVVYPPLFMTGFMTIPGGLVGNGISSIIPIIPTIPPLGFPWISYCNTPQGTAECSAALLRGPFIRRLCMTSCRMLGPFLWVGRGGSPGPPPMMKGTPGVAYSLLVKVARGVFQFGVGSNNLRQLEDGFGWQRCAETLGTTKWLFGLVIWN